MRSRGTTAPRTALRSARPFVVAHRAGNDLDALRRAEALGADLVEADVRLYRGRAVVRHLKTVGSLPLYWDRWRLASPFRRYPTVPEVLRHADPRSELMLDLKGRRRRLARLVLADLRPFLGERRITVCARWPSLLEELEGAPVRRLASAGSPRELRALLRRLRKLDLDGVSVHERLLDARALAEIRRATGLVLTWPANVPARAQALLELGVDGLISDHLEAIAPVVAAAR